ncbi:LysR family transcriptional regulator [Methylobacterium sp. P1-11]|uniref:LysR substrate-binding domain-containing protein n=1 Tax=Methylobacterium sp. P1-11 TaxID=2024616 RepID=UPI0011ECE0ED|nr:LysR substrate-binding domain-containing protein [Methylobacterium sp. P1-11]KAA0113264.1 LysR family transcriptional regulator [Methylobacterium sp. P1-11]
MAGRRPTRAQIELRHLRYFLTVVDELNFGRAAERLRIAQPGLSQQIKALEEIVGASLFDRSRRAIRLTLAGELFAEEARRALSQVERGLLLAQKASRGELGHITVGYVGSAAYTGVLTTIVGQFRQAFPDVQLDIAEMEMSRQLEELGEGRLDVGFVRPPVELPAGVMTVSIFQEEVVAAVPARHPLADLPRLPLGECRDDIFITPHHAPDVSFAHHTISACRAAGFSPKLGPQGRDFTTIVSMVSVGLGIALVPHSVGCIALPGIRYRPLEGTALTSELAVAFRRHDPSAAVRAFARHVRHGVRGSPSDKSVFSIMP